MTVPPKLALAYTASKSVAEPETSYTPPHHRVRRYSSNRKENHLESAVADEEDGWIAVGPKHHNNHAHHGARKSFGAHDDHHRKKFNERHSRGSFSKTQGNGSAVRQTVKAAAKENEQDQKETEQKEADSNVFEDDDDEGEWTTPAPKKTVRRNLEHANAVHA